MIRENKSRGISISGDLLIERSTISNNTGDFGAGIRVYGNLILRDSLVSNNLAEPRGNRRFSAYGGGIYVSGDLTIENSTISGNSAFVYGGGIFVAESRPGRPVSNVQIRNSTITQNSASGNVTIRTGGGIYVEEGNLFISNSIVAYNNRQRVREPSARDISIRSGSSLDMRDSLIGDVSGTGFTESAQPDVNGNILGGPELGSIDPRLGPLTYNGGPTLTHSLLPDSQAVDAAMASVGGEEFDQRGAGFARVFGGIPDMGAFELQTIVGDFDGDYAVGCDEVNQLAAAMVADGAFDDTYDLNGDLLVDDRDMGVLLTSIATHRLHSRDPLLPGDADLDGTVDGRDFNIWRSNRSTEARGICQADFNLDGVVDGTDFELWSENRFQSVFGGNGGNVARAEPRAPAPVSVNSSPAGEIAAPDRPRAGRWRMSRLRLERRSARHDTVLLTLAQTDRGHASPVVDVVELEVDFDRVATGRSSIER